VVVGVVPVSRPDSTLVPAILKKLKKKTKASVQCDIIQREAISSGHRRQICEIRAAPPVAAPKNRESPAEEQPLHSVFADSEVPKHTDGEQVLLVGFFLFPRYWRN